MPELLQNVPTQNTFVHALQLGPVKNCKQINWIGLGQPYRVQLWKPDPRDPNGQPVEEGTVREYPANASDAFQGVSGVSFASAIAGQPAQIYAQLSYAQDPLSLGSAITSATIGSNGQIVPNAAMVTGYVTPTGTIISGTGFTVAVLGAGDYQITYTSPFAAAPVTFATVVGAVAYMRSNAISASQVELLTSDGVSHQFQFVSIATQ